MWFFICFYFFFLWETWMMPYEHESKYSVVLYHFIYLESGLRVKVERHFLKGKNCIWSHSHNRKKNNTYIKTTFVRISTRHRLPNDWVHCNEVDLFALLRWSCLNPTGAVILSSALLLHCLIYCLQKQEAQERIYLK